MKLVITWDNLDDAINQLKELAEKIRQFPNDVAQESSDRIPYSGTGVSYSEGENHVYASGEGIAFQEYGSGFYADVTSINIDGKNMPSYPGVWSEDHKNTFATWQGHDWAYPYNNQPTHYMQDEVERLRRDTEPKAKDYFG